ncbi:hypothetical protein AR437_12700 [Christensenella hongkongensis]|uniref:YjdF family protein n=1 Tax=Christensenella hongkongensis TaxID=270498 RepID=UPI0007402E05|nr:YjdF family protein [Christensenella hongkongensis]KUJ24841.1 hypothetical protein AR437_12700 [Christensenella hongkongensis]
MNKAAVKLTVLFEEPFWIGIYERTANGKLEACKITFGAEPKDYEVHTFFLENWNCLPMSPPVDAGTMAEKRLNPKRMQRAVHRELSQAEVGTKSQQALKKQQEENKLRRKTVSREQREAEKELRFSMRQQKKKEKHRGR